jgi:hypothetical protein
MFGRPHERVDTQTRTVREYTMLMNYWPSKHGTHFTLALLVCDIEFNFGPNSQEAADDATLVDSLRGTMGIPSVLD